MRIDAGPSGPALILYPSWSYRLGVASRCAMGVTAFKKKRYRVTFVRVSHSTDF